MELTGDMNRYNYMEWCNLPISHYLRKGVNLRARYSCTHNFSITLLLLLGRDVFHLSEAGVYSVRLDQADMGVLTSFLGK